MSTRVTGGQNKKRRRLLDEFVKAQANGHPVSAKYVEASRAIVNELPTQELVDLPPVGKLKTLADWHKETATIYTLARSGRMPPEVASRLSWIANVGAGMARSLEEIKELAALRKQLIAMQGTPIGNAMALTLDAPRRSSSSKQDFEDQGTEDQGAEDSGHDQ